MQQQRVSNKRFFWLYIVGIVIAGIGSGLWFLAIGIPANKAFAGNPIFWSALALAFLLSIAHIIQRKKDNFNE
ncbi:hypothetical protein RQN30_06350 [Arcanobacterium hippocoleae]